jgi:hypothetical protein
MQRAQAAGQEREDELRMLAFRDVLGDEQEDRRLRQAMGLERFRASLRPEGTGEGPRQEYLYNDIYRQTYDSVLQETGDVGAALRAAEQAALSAAPRAPSARPAGGVSSAAAAQVQQLLQNNVPVATIRAQLVEAGLNPDDFEGLSE